MMATIIETRQYTLPTWSICAIAYGDSSGISEEEDRKVTQFENNLNEEVRNEYGPECHWCIDWPEDIDNAKVFAPSNDLDDLGADVVVVNVNIFSA